MNEDLKKKLIEYTAENAFVQTCGIEIWELEEDHAVMGTTARPELLNPMGMLHGGLLFTLADCCSGVTARTDGRTYVTQTGSLNYYRTSTRARSTRWAKCSTGAAPCAPCWWRSTRKKRGNCWQREHSPCLQRSTE